MTNFFKRYWLLPIVSAFLCYFNICKIDFFISWICYVPLFISVFYSSPKQTFKAGFIFGFALSVGCFFWMIPGAERFTGRSIIYGLIVFLVSALFLSLYYSTILYCFAWLKGRNKNSNSIVANSILIASFYTVAEALLSIASTGLPWFNIHSGNGLIANDYSIQPASFFGIHILTFIVVLVNYLFAWSIAKRLWLKLYVPAIVIGVYLLASFFLLKDFESKSNNNKPFKVAILAENIIPEMKWDENTGNFLVQKLLDINRSALALKPNIALWSESAIPWTYKKGDDLINEIVSITAPAQVTHILGINTEYKDNKVFNSAYCILPDGRVASRYDKQFLLSFIEKPLSGIMMPFYSSAGFCAVSNKQHAVPLNTPYGKAGIFICNEAAIPSASSNMVKHGAQFLVNISNDGWFNDTYIARLHFYYARLRAVESRKDLAINCNNGYSGLIKASGIIVEQEKSEEPFVEMGLMQPNKIISMATYFPDFFVYCCAVYIILIVIFQFISVYKKRVI